jgi:hypothetical protein
MSKKRSISRRTSFQSFTLVVLAALGIAGAVVLASDLRSDASAAASTTTMKMTTTTGMSMSSGEMARSGGLPTVKQTSLPSMQMSGKMPMPMAMVPLGEAEWEGMTIAARTSAPATFVLLNGSQQKMVKPTAKSSFHLMVLLSDAETKVAIPYSSVWATIRKGSKVVFDERLWPMVSRYMGPHYGNNVSLGGAGLYHLTLLVSPPAAARHMEYQGLWLKPHKVNLDFRWVPKS